MMWCELETVPIINGMHSFSQNSTILSRLWPGGGVIESHGK